MAVAITQTANPTSAGTGTTITYSTVAIGTAAADRVVVVCVSTELTAGAISSCTINSGGGAVAMTASTNGATGAVGARVFWLTVATGTTATIAITFAASQTASTQHITVYECQGASGTASSSGGLGDTDADPISSGAITIPASGGCVAVCAMAATGTRTWGGITKDIDAAIGTTIYQHTTGTSITAGSPTITVSGANNEDGALAWVVLSPSAVSVSANPTTVVGTGAAGTPTVSGKASASVTGVAGTGSVGELGAKEPLPSDWAGFGAVPYASAPFGGPKLTDPIISIPVSADVTGVSASGAAGTPTVVGKASADVSGVAGTGAAGTPTVVGKASVTLSGVSGTGAAGVLDVTVGADVSAPIVGVMAGAAVGALGAREPLPADWAGFGAVPFASAPFGGPKLADPIASGNVSVDVTGVAATGAAGTPTVSGKASTTVVGVSGTGAAGTPTVVGKASVTLTGVAGTGAAGTPTVSGKANVTLVGVTGTGAAGTPTVAAKASTTVVGVAAVGSAGIPTVVGKASTTVAGVVGTGSVGTLSVVGKASASVTGVAGTGQIGTLTAKGGASATLVGVAGAGAAGTPTVVGKATVTLDGVAGAGSVGTVTANTEGNVSAAPPGVAAAGSAGTPTVVGKASVTLAGVLATCAAGTITVTTATSVTANLSGVAATGFAGELSVDVGVPPVDGGAGGRNNPFIASVGAMMRR